MSTYFFFNTHYKKIKFIACLIALLIFCTYNNTFADTEKKSSTDINIQYKEILILSSKSNNMSWENEILQYLISKFSSDPTIRINTESISFIDNNETYIDKEAEHLSMKYEKTKFNLIICLDDESLEFVAKYYDSTFLYYSPIVYCGINNISIIDQYPFNLFTGVIEAPNPKVLIDTILNISPETTKINIILDESIASDQIEKILHNFEPYYSSKVTFNYIKSNYIEDITLSLKSINNSNPSILVGNFKSPEDIHLSASDTISILKSSHSGQLYTLNSSYIGNGVIGGYLFSSANHGNLIYEISTRILNGTPVQSISPLIDLYQTLLFDLSEVTYHRIDRRNLPKNTVYINENWINQTFSGTVVLCLLIILFVFIILMVILAIQKNKNEKKATLVKARYDEVVINDKMKTEFIANFSHEIRTLLNLILSSIQLLEVYNKNGRIKFNDKRDALKLSNIRQNGFRLLKLINNLIDITKLESGFYKTEFEIKNIVEIIEDITLSVVEYANDKGIHITFDTNVEEFFMPVDIEKIDRILLNLLSNAIKFTPNNGSVFVTLCCESNNITFSVKDTGVGISKMDQEFIFNRFIQTTNTNSINTTGSGIGLSLVKSLVELLDGSIKLKSELNNGSEFIVCLPVKDYDKTDVDTVSNVNLNLANNNDKIKVEFSDL